MPRTSPISQDKIIEIDNKPTVQCNELLIISLTVIGNEEKDGPKSQTIILFQKLMYWSVIVPSSPYKSCKDYFL